VGVICSMYETASVVIAASLTMAVTTTLSIYALTAKKDFSNWGAGLYSGLCCVIVGSILHLFIPFSSALNALISVGGAVLFSCFIIYDTDQIQRRMSPDDYIIGNQTSPNYNRL